VFRRDNGPLSAAMVYPKIEVCWGSLRVAGAPVAHVWPNVIARRPELGPVESTISHSPVEPAALDAMTPMRNDLRRCDGRKTDIKELRKSNAPLQSS
jgi:hypothetical protein